MTFSLQVSRIALGSIEPTLLRIPTLWWLNSGSMVSTSHLCLCVFESQQHRLSGILQCAQSNLLFSLQKQLFLVQFSKQ